MRISEEIKSRTKVNCKTFAKEYESFEQIKQNDKNGIEFWYARNLSVVFQYVQCRNFQNVIDCAMFTCKNSGFNDKDHFVEVSKTIKMPKQQKNKL